MIMTVIIFLIVLAALIFVHELGHFAACRIFGIRVDEFALGFGPTIWKRKGKETVYALRAIPFGGFVKIFGEDPDDESIKGSDSSRSFVNAKRWKQAVVLVSGVLGNFIFAWLLATIALSIGTAASPSDYPEYANRMTDARIMIDQVSPSSPAAVAGIKQGDVITAVSPIAVDLSTKPFSIDTIISNTKESAGKPLTLSLIRDGKPISVQISAKQNIISDEPKAYAIGIAMSDAATLRLPIYLAAYESVRFTWVMMKEIYGVIAGLFQGAVSVSNLAGPVYIAQQVGDAAKLGFSYLLMFTAFISVNLGILNILPIPALDGGRLLFVAIESVIRRRIKPIIANSVNLVGFALLMLLMVFVTYRDILRMFK